MQCGSSSGRRYPGVPRNKKAQFLICFSYRKKIHAAERAEWGDLDGKSSFLYLEGNLKLRYSSIQHLIQMKAVEMGKHTLTIGVTYLFKPVQEAFAHQDALITGRHVMIKAAQRQRLV